MLFARLREDIACILERDPAARTAWEVLTCYPVSTLWPCTAARTGAGHTG